MYCKTVKLNILCSKTPFELIITSCDGSVIKKEVINAACITICIRTKQRYIKLFAKHNNQILYQKISLRNVKYQRIFVNFAFKKVISKMVFCLITLTDAVYGLPVKSALLEFKQIGS